MKLDLEKKELVKKLLKKGILVTPSILEKLNEKNIPYINKKLNSNVEIDIEKLFQEEDSVKKTKYVSLSEKRDKAAEVQDKNNLRTKVIFCYDREPKPRDVPDFTNHFNSRFKILKKILQERQELSNASSINKILNKQVSGQVATIGLVYEKVISQKGNLLITLEDPTGIITVVVNKNKYDLFSEAEDLVYDEVIGVTGVSGNKVIFADKIIQPDTPITKELKKSPDEVYAVFTSDIHVGTKLFLQEDFEKFIAWLNCEAGTEEQRRIASKVKYLFIAGDLVEGVGVFPNQEKILSIPDIKEQYSKLVEYIKRIRKDIEIIMIPGNHDALRLSEPQPPLSKEYVKELYETPNVFLLSNPSMVNIHSSETFPGFDVLLYHGSSFHYYANNVDSIRLAGGIKRADLIMKFLLKRRHLAPSHQSNLYIPDPDNDFLVIEKVPDFFVTGDIHRVTATNYKNITIINSSTWSKESENQIKMGIEPQTSRAVIVNLQTRDLKIMKFSSEAE